MITLIALRLFLIECKNRCKNSIDSEATKLSMKLCQKHTCLNWDDPNLSKAVVSTHELVQCLHHEATYELDNVALMIGDR